jgi:hypothetical protein
MSNREDAALQRLLFVGSGVSLALLCASNCRDANDRTLSSLFFLSTIPVLWAYGAHWAYDRVHPAMHWILPSLTGLAYLAKVTN